MDKTEALMKAARAWCAETTSGKTIDGDLADAFAEVLMREVNRVVHDLGHERTLEERDRAEDALQEAHVALGGDGEWAGRIPRPAPPDSGDLCLDVPELARQVMDRVGILVVMVKTLEEEIARLLRGEFTPEELQNLCHGLSENAPKEFAEGCRVYNEKLFGARSELHDGGCPYERAKDYLNSSRPAPDKTEG